MIHTCAMISYTQMKIRLSQALKDQIEKSATESNRSLNSEIISRLEASFPNVDFGEGQSRRALRRDKTEIELENLRAGLRAEEARGTDLEQRLKEVIFRLDKLERGERS